MLKSLAKIIFKFVKKKVKTFFKKKMQEKESTFFNFFKTFLTFKENLRS